MTRATWRGLGLALAILLGWLLSLVALVAVDIAQRPAWMVGLAVLARTVLQTGLFIVGHDAMHGLLLPGQPRLNDRLGSLVLGLYAALPYGPCRDSHHRHHRHPGGQQDPDFRPSPTTSPWAWYVGFMARYLAPGQMTLLVGGWGLVALLDRPHSPAAGLNVLVVCTLPLLLSSLQLFLVGTYLPHRRAGAGGDHHHATSLDLPEWLSLLACYHFGYHWEHHAQPGLAWFQLPQLRRQHRNRPLAESGIRA